DARTTELEEAIEAELVEHLLGQAGTGFVIGAVTVAASVLVLWNAAPLGALLAWLASMGLLSLPAFLVVSRLRRTPPRPGKTVSRRQSLAIAYGLAGAGWGTAAIILYPRVAMPFQLFLVFVLGGSGVGGMAALAPVRAAYVAYLSGTFLPMVGVLLARGSLSSVATGLLLLTYWLATITLASELRA